jgi:G3E family GTPase
MKETAVEHTPGVLVLPPSVITKTDLAYLVSEAERVDRNMTDRAARAKAGVVINQESAISEQLSDFLSKNKFDLGNSEDRSRLVKHLRHLKSTAPTIHLTFAAVPDKQSLRRIVAWLRNSVHAHAVILVGLQPSLIGGVYIRTTNHVHDLSLRAQLAGHRDLIIKEVEALNGRS